MSNRDKSRPFGTLPDWLLRIEAAYDLKTGGWRSAHGLDYGSVELEVGRLWHALVLLQRPRLVLETGTFSGYSTCCIAAALAALGGERCVYTIDPEPRTPIWKGTELAPFIHPVVARSQDAAPQFADVTFDMLVLDSDHHYDTIITELALYEPRLAVGGLILLHDTLFFDGVGAAVSQLLAQPRFRGVTLDTPRHHEFNTPRCPGVTIVRKAAAGAPVTFDPRFAGWFVGSDSATPVLRQGEAR